MATPSTHSSGSPELPPHRIHEAQGSAGLKRKRGDHQTVESSLSKATRTARGCYNTALRPQARGDMESQQQADVTVPVVYMSERLREWQLGRMLGQTAYAFCHWVEGVVFQGEDTGSLFTESMKHLSKREASLTPAQRARFHGVLQWSSALVPASRLKDVTAYLLKHNHFGAASRAADGSSAETVRELLSYSERQFLGQPKACFWVKRFVKLTAKLSKQGSPLNPDKTAEDVFCEVASASLLGRFDIA